jgi:dTDP-D-glucose 4,6-dehydratase
MRQWTPVEITAQIILDKVNAEAKFDVLHIANKNGLVSNNFVVDILTDIIASTTDIEPRIEYIGDRPGHDLCYALKTSPDVDNYFKDIKLVDVIASTAEFYYMKREDYR